MALIKDGKIYRTFEEQLIYLTENKQDISDVVEAVANKQDKLIAGENITIEDNIISASGGGSSEVWEDITDDFSIVDTTSEYITQATTNFAIRNKPMRITVETFYDDGGVVGADRFGSTVRSNVFVMGDVNLGGWGRMCVISGLNLIYDEPVGVVTVRPFSSGNTILFEYDYGMPYGAEAGSELPNPKIIKFEVLNNV